MQHLILILPKHASFFCLDKETLAILPYDDIHDQEISNEANHADNHVDDHYGDFDPSWQQGVRLIVIVAEVVMEKRDIEERDPLQQEVLWELHR